MSTQPETKGSQASPRIVITAFRAVARWRHGLARDTGGAIVLHIAEHHAGLFPDDADARARAITWMFAALNTVEPPILELVTARFAEGDKPWAEERLPLVKDRIRDRLSSSWPAWAMPTGSMGRSARAT